MAVPSLLDSALDHVSEGWYESSTSPQDALGRAARRLSSGGALYLGGGVGVEKVGEKFALTGGGKRETHPGPLSAVTAAFTRAGGSTAGDTPGGSTAITDPNAAARLRELFENEKETKQDIQRMEARRQRSNSMTVAGLPMRGPSSWDSYDESRLAELQSRLAQIAAERKRLLAGGAVEEADRGGMIKCPSCGMLNAPGAAKCKSCDKSMANVKAKSKLTEAEVGKPGTNWKQVTPANRKKVDPLVRHWMSKPHPWQSCVDELAPEKGMEAAKRICSVVKDMGERRTTWRKGGRKGVREANEALIIELAEEARERLLALEAAFGEGASAELAEAGYDELPSALHRQIAEMAYSDRSLLYLVGWLAEEEFVREAKGPGERTALKVTGQAGKRRPLPPLPKGSKAAGQKTTASKSGSSKSSSKNGKSSSAGSSGKGKGGQFAGSQPGGQYIRVGASGSDVKAVQGKVGAKTDGQFGKQTQQAVRKFQAKHGLKVDGVVGRQTAAALAGKKGAKNLKPGAMSAQQRKQLGGKGKGKAAKSGRVREGVLPDPFDSLLSEAPWDSSLHPRGGFSRNRGLFSPAGMLIENHDLYFTKPKGSIDIPMDRLTPDHHEPASIRNAMKYMAEAAAGKRDKRKPISLRDNGDGTYTVTDGNATFGAAKAAGWSSIRGLVTERPRRRLLRRRDGFRRSWFDPANPELMQASMLTEGAWDPNKHPRGGRNRGWFRKGFGGGSRNRTDLPSPSASKPGEEQRGLKGPARQPGGRAPATPTGRGKPRGGPSRTSYEGVKAARAARTPPQGGPGQSELIAFDPPDDTKARLAGMFTDEERNAPKATHKATTEEALFAEAAPALDAYKRLLNMGGGVAKRIGGQNSTPEQALAAPDKPHVIIAPLKGRERSREKVETKYEGDWSKLGDVVRGTIAVPTMDDLPGTIDALRTEAKKQGWKITAPENRYVYVEGDHVNTGPVPAGYRDVAVILEAPNGVVAELQINTGPMMAAKQNEGHKLYEVERAIYAKAARQGRPLNSQERRRVEDLQTQASQLYGQAFADSFSARASRRARGTARRGRRSRRG